MISKPVFVTKPVLPSLDEFVPLLEEIWSSRILTNRGPLHERFEEALAERLGARHITVVNNASIGLMLAIKNLIPDGGEIITTPFSFVATANAIMWSGSKPVFADIEPDSLNLDPEQIERHITPQTKAILAVHCYGQPCRTQRIEAIAKAHGLKVIYDAAHAFGVQHPSINLATSGDLSVYSFHATKVFNTFEGGAIVAPDLETKIALDRLSNHGIIDETSISSIGLNGKMSELNAAVGILQLQHLDAAIEKRRARTEQYLELLSDVPGIRCVLSHTKHYASNYYAFPIIVQPDYPLSVGSLQARLQALNIYTRRYFHPLISNLQIYQDLASASPERLPIANSMASRVLCLPLFPDLTEDVVSLTAHTIRDAASVSHAR